MTLIEHVTDAGALPTLARTIQFAARRHSVIAHNIANASTPRFQHKDVAPAEFQSALREAVDERRASTGGQHGELRLKGTRQIEVTDRGLRFDAQTQSGRGVLAHDRNNRDLESLMKDMTENQAAFRVATELMRTQAGTMRAAITERP
ncbi:MAG: flagellar basal body rod protein FlgB [Planctomycetota bacterium]